MQEISSAKVQRSKKSKSEHREKVAARKSGTIVTEVECEYGVEETYAKGTTGS